MNQETEQRLKHNRTSVYLYDEVADITAVVKDRKGISYTKQIELGLKMYFQSQHKDILDEMNIKW